MISLALCAVNAVDAFSEACSGWQMRHDVCVQSVHRRSAVRLFQDSGVQWVQSVRHHIQCIRIQRTLMDTESAPRESWCVRAIFHGDPHIPAFLCVMCSECRCRCFRV